MSAAIGSGERLKPGDALLIVDVQRDFCAGGKLAVEGADEVVEPLNRWLEAADAVPVPILASRDWHPRDHVSFWQSGGPWPPHCEQDSPGARFHPALRLPPSTRVVTKGARLDHDQNSAFDDTGLAVELRRLGVRRLWVGGLAEDVCVRATVLDALDEGFEVHLLRAATRPVHPEKEPQVLAELRSAGAVIEESP